MTEPTIMYTKSWKVTYFTEYANKSQVKELLEQNFPYTFDASGNKLQHFAIKSSVDGLLKVEAPEKLTKGELDTLYDKSRRLRRSGTSGLSKYSRTAKQTSP